jgi:hypothetical protein
MNLKLNALGIVYQSDDWLENLFDAGLADRESWRNTLQAKRSRAQVLDMYIKDKAADYVLKAGAEFDPNKWWAVKRQISADEATDMLDGFAQLFGYPTYLDLTNHQQDETTRLFELMSGQYGYAIYRAYLVKRGR